MNTCSRIALTAFVLTGMGAAPALASDCSDLAKLALKDTHIDKAELVAAGKFAPPTSPFGASPGVMSRPLCPYPQVAHYNGSGDMTAAGN